MAYSYNKFLKPLKDSDKTIRIYDDSNNPTYVLNPFSVLRVFITNLNLNISLSGNRTLSLDFPSVEDCKSALAKLQQYIDILKRKAPVNVESGQKNYVKDVVEASTGIYALNALSSKQQSFFFPNNDPNIKISATSTGGTQSGLHKFNLFWNGILSVDRGGLNNTTFNPQEILMYDDANSSVISSGYKIDDTSTSGQALWTAGQIQNYITNELINMPGVISEPFNLTVSDFDTGTTFSNIKNIIFRGGVVDVPNTGTATGVIVTGNTPTVTVWIPTPPPAIYASHFNTMDGNTNGVISDNINGVNVRISSPTSEGNPFQVGDWAGQNKLTITQNTITIHSTDKVTGFSSDVNGDSTITVDFIGADGTTLSSLTSPTLYGNTSISSGGVSMTISGYSIDDSGVPDLYTIKWKANISITVNITTIFSSLGLDGGRFSIRISHKTDSTDGGSIYTYQTNEVFYDSNPNTPSITSTTISESSNSDNIITKHISGVEYYTTGSVFEVLVSGIDNLNKNTQGFNGGVSKNFTLSSANYNLPSLDLKAWSPTVGSFIGWDNYYKNSGVNYTYLNWTIQASSTYRYRGNGANVSSRAYDPWNSSSLNTSSSSFVLIDQFSDNSTRLGESFNGETNRLKRVSSTYSTWDSTDILGNNITDQTGNYTFCDACVVGGYLVRPDKYHRTDTAISVASPDLTLSKPNKGGSNPNYTNHTGVATYHRKFWTTSALNIPSFVMTFGGIWPTQYPDAKTALENSQIKVYIRKVSSLIGNYGPDSSPLALHGGLFNSGSPDKPFDDGNGGVDSLGSLIRTGVGVNNNTINATFGGSHAQYGFWMELQIINPDIKIDFINVTLNFSNGTSDSVPVV